MGVGLIKLGRTEMLSSVYGGRLTGRTNSLGFPAGSGAPEWNASLCAATVATKPSGSTPAARATAAREGPAPSRQPSARSTGPAETITAA